MSERLDSSVLSTRDLCELAILADADDWSSFWTVWTSMPKTFSLSSPAADVVLQILDWLGSELKKAVPMRVDRDWWPLGTSAKLSGVGISVVACMSAHDGNQLLKTISGRITLAEGKRIADAYNPKADTAVVAVDKALSYLKKTAAAIASRDEGRLLMISYEDVNGPGPDPASPDNGGE